MSGTVVFLNVGGVVFQTSPSTLANGSHFFSSMVRTHADQVEFTIDRDPTHFRHILNWLRGVRCLPEDDAVAMKELWWEADYYSMHDMSEAINRAPRKSSFISIMDSIAKELKGLRKS